MFLIIFNIIESWSSSIGSVEARSEDGGGHYSLAATRPGPPSPRTLRSFQVASSSLAVVRVGGVAQVVEHVERSALLIMFRPWDASSLQYNLAAGRFYCILHSELTLTYTRIKNALRKFVFALIDFSKFEDLNCFAP